MAENDLTGKVAIITGAGNGIGRAIAGTFSAAGAAVLCADIMGEDADATAAHIRQRGASATGCRCDVGDTSSVKAAVEMAVAEFGRLDIVVANAAIQSPLVPLERLEEDDWDRAISVNLTGAFLVCKHAIPHLQGAGGGSIVLVASQLARVALPNYAAYCATKGGLVQLAKAMALEQAKNNIRVNSLSPAGTMTGRMVRQFGDMESAQRTHGPRHPLGRLADPDEIARGALFLASDSSSFMTGADLLMDGGYTAW